MSLKEKIKSLKIKIAQKAIGLSSFWNSNRNVVSAIKKEQEKKKYHFFAFGKISKSDLEKELVKYDFSFPKELINIWLEYGGGELWETENILYPLITDDILIETVHKYMIFAKDKNFDANYFIFATDTVSYTAFNKHTHDVKIFTFKNNTWFVEKCFKDIIDWFSYILWAQHNALVLTKE